MLKAVEGMVVAKCKQFLRSGRGNCLDTSAFDDAAQDCRMYLWKVAGTFRPDGPAKWSTFAYTAVGHVVKRIKDDVTESTLRGQIDEINFDMGYLTDPRPSDESGESDESDGIDLDTVERYLGAVHRAMFAPILEVLTPSQQRLVELVVFRRLSLPQVADQLGQKLNIVEKNFRGVLSRLHARGVLTEEMAATFGVTIRKLTPARAWAVGEKDLFLAAVQSDRSTADIAAAFGVPVPRVAGVRRNLVSVLATHAKRKEAAERRPLAKRGQVDSWPADEKDRFLVAITSDRSDADIAAEFRIPPARVRHRRGVRPARTPADLCAA